MKIILNICIGALVTFSVFATDSYFIDKEKSYEIARSVESVNELFEKLGKFGVVGNIKGSTFYRANLSQTSGLPSSEYYVFKQKGNRLKLVAQLPLKYMTQRKSEFKNNKLSIYENSDDTEGWELVLVLNE